MKKKYLLTAILFLIFTLLLSNCSQNTSNQSQPYSTHVDKEASIERGRYLVGLMDCNSCHTPKKMTKLGPIPDPEKLLSGHPDSQPFAGLEKGTAAQDQWLRFNHDLTTAIGPWGVSFSANLTPDPTGLGDWTFEQFKKAITEGKHKGMDNERMLLPPMPWQSYAELKEEDVQALFDYLQNIKPIKNKVPAPIPPA